MEAETLEFEQTEAGLLSALARLDRARKEGDLQTEALVLLRLNHLVKWVRSDNDESPFLRAESLALEALELFRRIGDEAGQVGALIRAVSLFRPDVMQARLAEAERLASELGDRKLIADVLAAQSRNLGIRDPEAAQRLGLEAVDLYRALGDKRSTAACLFSLCVTAEGPDKTRYALESFHLYRELSLPDDATRALQLAAMFAQNDAGLIELEADFRQALEEATARTDHHAERGCYRYLAKIAAAKGNVEEAQKFSRWLADLEGADGRSDLERWQENVEMTKMLHGYCKAQGNKVGAKEFREELKRLKASKPKA